MATRAQKRLLRPSNSGSPLQFEHHFDWETIAPRLGMEPDFAVARDMGLTSTCDNLSAQMYVFATKTEARRHANWMRYSYKDRERQPRVTVRSRAVSADNLVVEVWVVTVRW